MGPSAPARGGNTPTTAEGGFAIPDLPPGTYAVGAWHPFLGVRDQEVTVTAGEATEINLEFTARY